jgi:hypothetical protein
MLSFFLAVGLSKSSPLKMDCQIRDIGDNVSVEGRMFVRAQDVEKANELIHTVGTHHRFICKYVKKSLCLGVYMFLVINIV